MWRVMFLVSLASCDSLGHDCTDIGCGPTVDAKLNAGTTAVEGAVVQICRNAVCATATLAALPAGGTGQLIHLSGPLAVDATVWNFNTRVEIEWQITRIEDGLDTDRFTATLSASDGSMLDHKSYVASYTETMPNGEDCGVCPRADLTEQ